MFRIHFENELSSTSHIDVTAATEDEAFAKIGANLIPVWVEKLVSFLFCWKDGRKEVGFGVDVADAFHCIGGTNGQLAALDCYVPYQG